MAHMNLEHCVAVLERTGVPFESGLTAAEIAAAEAHFAFVFPPDLSAFLAFALPTGKALRRGAISQTLACSDR